MNLQGWIQKSHFLCNISKFWLWTPHFAPTQSWWWFLCFLFIYLAVYTWYLPTDYICLFVAAWASKLMWVSSRPPVSCLCTFHLCHDSASGVSLFRNCLVLQEAEPLMIIEPFVPLLVHTSFPWWTSFFSCFAFGGDTLRWGAPSFYTQ